jgi:hypothetical protein
MKISKTIKEGKITSFSITFEDDEEVGCAEDMTIFSERALVNHFEYRNKLPDIVSRIKKELQ